MYTVYLFSTVCATCTVQYVQLVKAKEQNPYNFKYTVQYILSTV
jgi:hypothetical protein